MNVVFRLGNEDLWKLGPELGLVVQLGFTFRCENFQDVTITFYLSLMEVSQGDFYKVKVNPYRMPIILFHIQIYSYPKEYCHHFQGTLHFSL